MARRRPREPFPGYNRALAFARAQADAELKTYRDQIAAEQARAAQAGRDRAATIQGSSQGLADVLKGIAPGIEGAYSDSAQRQSHYAAGFSQGLRMLQQQSAGQANDVLGKIGAPEGQMLQGDQGAGDVLYGLGGLIPADTFEAQGAAFGAAARMLPATALRTGQADLQQELQRQGQEQGDFEKQIGDLLAKRPELVRSIFGDTLSQVERERALAQGDALKAASLGETARHHRATERISAYRATNLTPYQRSQIRLAQQREKRLRNQAAKGNVNAQDELRLGQDVLGLRDDVLGSPVKSSGRYARGQYIAKPGAKNVFDDGTTNDPKKARTDGMTWKDAFEYVYGYAADSLRAAGHNDKYVRQWVRSKLIQLGLTPPRGRGRQKPQPHRGP